MLLPVLVGLAILRVRLARRRIQPRGVPVGVAGAAPASHKLVGTLSAAQPGAFDLRAYVDEKAAETAIENRDVYGAFVVAPAGWTSWRPVQRDRRCRNC